MAANQNELLLPDRELVTSQKCPCLNISEVVPNEGSCPIKASLFLQIRLCCCLACASFVVYNKHCFNCSDLVSSFTACYFKPQHWVAQKRELKLPVSELGLSFSHGNSSSPVVRATLMVLKGSPAVQLPSLVVSVGELFLIPFGRQLIQGKSAHWLLFFRLFWSW